VVLCRVCAWSSTEVRGNPMESLEILFLVYLMALGALGWLYWMVNEFS
jgi:hypothetical protein